MATVSKLQQFKSVLEAGFKLASAHLQVWARSLEPGRTGEPENMGRIYSSGVNARGIAYETRSAVFETAPGAFQLFQVTREMQTLPAPPKSPDDSLFQEMPMVGWVNTARIPLRGNTRIFDSWTEAIEMRKVYDAEAAPAVAELSPKAM